MQMNPRLPGWPMIPAHAKQSGLGSKTSTLAFKPPELIGINPAIAPNVDHSITLSDQQREELHFLLKTATIATRTSTLRALDT